MHSRVKEASLKFTREDTELTRNTIFTREYMVFLPSYALVRAVYNYARPVTWTANTLPLARGQVFNFSSAGYVLHCLR